MSRIRPVGGSPTGDGSAAPTDRALGAVVNKLRRALAKADNGATGFVRLRFGTAAKVLPRLIAHAAGLAANSATPMADRQALQTLYDLLRAHGSRTAARWAAQLNTAIAAGEKALLLTTEGTDDGLSRDALAFVAEHGANVYLRIAAGERLAAVDLPAEPSRADATHGKSAPSVLSAAAALTVPGRREAAKVNTGTLDARRALPQAQRAAILEKLRSDGAPAALTDALAASLLPDASGKAKLRVSVLIANGHTLVYTNALAKGGFGRFHVAWDVGEQRLVAIKGLRLGTDGAPASAARKRKPFAVAATEPHFLDAEIDVMRRVGSPLHTGKLLTRNDKVYLVVPLFEGDLNELTKTLSDLERAAVVPSLARQLAQQLRRCHEAGLVHCDIKPANVLFDKGGSFVLADYGLATDVHPKTGRAAGIAGSYAYLAPEILEERATSPASDIFALGLTCMEQAIGKRVFEHFAGLDWVSTSRAQFAREHQRLPRRPDGKIDFAQLGRDDFAEKVAKLAILGVDTASFIVDRMLHPDPSRRANADEVEAYFAAAHPAAVADALAEQSVQVAAARDLPQNMAKQMRAVLTRTFADLFVAAPRAGMRR